jgi:hypothetical protein
MESVETFTDGLYAHRDAIGWRPRSGRAAGGELRRPGQTADVLGDDGTAEPASASTRYSRGPVGRRDPPARLSPFCFRTRRCMPAATWRLWSSRTLRAIASVMP